VYKEKTFVNFVQGEKRTTFVKIIVFVVVHILFIVFVRCLNLIVFAIYVKH
jgi:hypothetical protein